MEKFDQKPTGRQSTPTTLSDDSESKYRMLMEQASDAILISDLESRYMEVNSSACEMFGYSRDELLKLSITDVVPPEDIKATPLRYGELIEGKIVRIERRIRRKDGTIVPVEVSAKMLQDGRVQAIVRDITERKRAEEALRESEQKYLTLLERMNEGVLYVDNSEMIQYVNQRFLDMSGYSRQELVGKVASELLLDDDDRKLVREKNELRRLGFADQYEVRLRRKSGDKILVQISGAPVFDAAGEIIGSIGIHTDVTARRWAEEALAAEKERLAVTLRSIGDGVIAADNDGKVVLMNYVAETLTGWPQEEAQCKPLAEVLHLVDENSRHRCENPAEQVLRAGQTVRLDTQPVLVSRDKCERIIAGSAAPIRDREGKTIGVVLVLRDITDRRKMEAELLKASKLDSVGVLAGGIAHDFNNLLTGILGNISLAKMHAPTDERLHQRLVEAEHASFRARDLTQQLLTFSRGGAPIKKTASIVELLRESATFALTGSSARCDFSIQDDLWPVEVDEGQMSQVIHNLALNAQQAMPGGGVVEIHAHNLVIGSDSSKRGLPLAAGKYVRIAVIDRGIGIPEEHIQKIFDPYFTTKHKGSGLGLATSYSIIRNHNGYIGVESKLGSGATFHIYLPASEKDVRSRPQPGLKPTAAKGRILLMDDEEVIRHVAGEMLGLIGYEVCLAKEGAEAADLYRDALQSGRPFDAVILDLTVPGGMGGMETMRTLLEMDPAVKAVVSSGYSNDPVMAQFNRYGFKGVAAKPYRIEDLRHTLRDVIHAR